MRSMIAMKMNLSVPIFRTIVSASSDERRYVDDAFVRICQMVNDLSMKVRVQAASLLGSLHLVSARYLEQTLDKKVMSHLKVSLLLNAHVFNGHLPKISSIVHVKCLHLMTPV